MGCHLNVFLHVHTINFTDLFSLKTSKEVFFQISFSKAINCICSLCPHHTFYLPADIREKICIFWQ